MSKIIDEIRQAAKDHAMSEGDNGNAEKSFNEGADLAAYLIETAYHEKFTELNNKLKIAIKALEKLSKTGDGIHKDNKLSVHESLPTLQIEFNERIDFAKTALEKIK